MALNPSGVTDQDTQVNRENRGLGLFGGATDQMFQSFRQDANRLLNEFFSDFENFRGSNQPQCRETPVDMAYPPVDVIENGNEIIIHADLPGISKENVDVGLRENYLIISGEEKHNTDGIIKVKERPSGKFRRVIALPGSAEPEKIQARLEQGVLEIKLQQIEKAEGKRIDIQ
ncbi:hypothetical protein G9A89_010603 [Geosiphon pyriformis]|nr:hypothetical protein G9A89_010603 [Geosiphon pyriformis]